MVLQYLGNAVKSPEDRGIHKPVPRKRLYDLLVDNHGFELVEPSKTPIFGTSVARNGFEVCGVEEHYGLDVRVSAPGRAIESGDFKIVQALFGGITYSLYERKVVLRHLDDEDAGRKNEEVVLSEIAHAMGLESLGLH